MRNKMPLYTNSRIFEKLPNRIEALQIFWQSFFHDVRAKVSSILTVCNVTFAYRDSQLMSVKTAVKSTIRLMDKMWQDIRLDLSTIKTWPAAFPFHSWLQELIRMFKLVHDLPDNEVKMSLDPKLNEAIIETDELLLTQVITNLLGNAFRLSDPCSVIELSCKEQKSGLVIGVSHEGVLPMQETDDVFCPYLRGEDYTYNIGLGLYLCRVYVEEMGGTIDASFKDGRTLFTVALPGIIKQHVQQFPDM